MNQRGISSSQGSPGVTQPESHSQPSHFTLHGFLLSCSAARDRDPCLLTPSSGDRDPPAPVQKVHTAVPNWEKGLWVPLDGQEGWMPPSPWGFLLQVSPRVAILVSLVPHRTGAIPSTNAGTSKPFGINLPPCSNIQQPKAAASCVSWNPQISPTPVSSTIGNRGVRIKRVLVAFYLWILGFAPGTGMSGNMEHCQVGHRNVTASLIIKPALH